MGQIGGKGGETNYGDVWMIYYLTTVLEEKPNKIKPYSIRYFSHMHSFAISENVFCEMFAFYHPSKYIKEEIILSSPFLCSPSSGSFFSYKPSHILLLLFG